MVPGDVNSYPIQEVQTKASADRSPRGGLSVGAFFYRKDES
jgi:hypothetical protein